MKADRQWETALMRALQVTTADFAARCEPGEAKNALEKLAENFRCSDPVTSPALADAEADLTACVQELERALAEGDLENIPALCRGAEASLSQRNRLCRLYKAH